MSIFIELHSSDLSADCLKSVELRLNGKVLGEMTTALYRGNLFHAAAESVHQWGDTEATLAEHVNRAHAKVAATAAKENRPLTHSVTTNLADIQGEVHELLEQYVARVLPFLNHGTLIGVEVPIRLTLDIDGEPQNFASHLDLLYRFPSNALGFYDWKTQEDAPGFDFLRRSPQMALYSLAIAEGEVLVDGDWVALQQWPIGHWIHVNYLKVYKRKTTIGDEVFNKGDTRDINKIVIETGITEAGRQAIIDELTTRVRMFRAGLYPTNPGEQRCRFCESRTFCPAF